MKHMLLQPYLLFSGILVAQLLNDPDTKISLPAPVQRKTVGLAWAVFLLSLSRSLCHARNSWISCGALPIRFTGTSNVSDVTGQNQTLFKSSINVLFLSFSCTTPVNIKTGVICYQLHVCMFLSLTISIPLHRLCEKCRHPQCCPSESSRPLHPWHLVHLADMACHPDPHWPFHCCCFPY